MAEGDGPTLYTNKPRKEQLKKAKLSKPSSSSTSAGMGSQSTSTATPPPPPPPPPPKVPFGRRFRFVWPMLLAVNLAVGAYLFMRTKKKDNGVEEEPDTTASTKETTAHVSKTPVLPPVTKPEIQEPIPEHQQRELFKWILEEKRKVKPKDPEEKRRIDEEKAVLKQFIRAKSIPHI